MSTDPGGGRRVPRADIDVFRITYAPPSLSCSLQTEVAGKARRNSSMAVATSCFTEQLLTVVVRGDCGEGQVLAQLDLVVVADDLAGAVGQVQL